LVDFVGRNVLKIRLPGDFHDSPQEALVLA
jgi:hypothetical protein